MILQNLHRGIRNCSGHPISSEITVEPPQQKNRGIRNSSGHPISSEITVEPPGKNRGWSKTDGIWTWRTHTFNKTTDGTSKLTYDIHVLSLRTQTHTKPSTHIPSQLFYYYYHYYINKHQQTSTTSTNINYIIPTKKIHITSNTYIKRTHTFISYTPSWLILLRHSLKTLNIMHKTLKIPYVTPSTNYHNPQTNLSS